MEQFDRIQQISTNDRQSASIARTGRVRIGHPSRWNSLRQKARHPHAKSRSSNSTRATSMATVLYIMQYNNAQARYAKGTSRPAEIGA
jgi:hypothetical protein